MGDNTEYDQTATQGPQCRPVDQMAFFPLIVGLR